MKLFLRPCADSEDDPDSGGGGLSFGAKFGLIFAAAFFSPFVCMFALIGVTKYCCLNKRHSDAPEAFDLNRQDTDDVDAPITVSTTACLA